MTPDDFVPPEPEPDQPPPGLGADEETPHPGFSDPVAEAEVLGILIVDPQPTPLTPAAFDDPRHRIVFDCITSLPNPSPEAIAQALHATGQLDVIGGFAALSGLVQHAPSSLSLRALTRRLQELHTRRTARDQARRVLEMAETAPLAALSAALKPAATQGALQSKPLPTFALPPAGDPSILIGDRWLNRGDLAILASTSGMGKSSLSLQAAVTWALGRPLFDGFKPNGPLRSILFQSEDSDGDIAEVWLSLQKAMRLTPDEITQVRQNVLIVTDRIHRGLSFRAEIEHHVNAHKPDLVWINPLLAFIQGDVNQATDTGEFIRQQLNSLNEPPRFGYILIHHTAKPPKERKERQWNEVMYEMAGSADLTNAARAILALQATETQGTFKLIGAKRGIRAGLTQLTPSSANASLKYAQPTAVIHLKHSAERLTVNDRDIPLIHWERVEPEPPPPPKNKGGRPATYDHQKMLLCVPGPGDKPANVNQIFRTVGQMPCGISARAFKDVLAKWVETGEVESINDRGLGWVFKRRQE